MSTDYENWAWKTTTNTTSGDIRYGEDENGVYTYRFDDDVIGQPYYLYNSTPYKWGTRYNVVLKPIIDSGKFNQLRDLLINKYGMPSSVKDINDVFMAYFDRALYSNTVYNTNEARFSDGVGNQKTLLQYLKSASAEESGGNGYKGPVTTTYITGKEKAKDIFKSMVLELTGVAPSKGDFDEFYKVLNAREKRFVSKQSGQRSQQYVDNRMDVNSFTLKYILRKLDIDSDMSGKVGVVQDVVEQAITNYGLTGLVGNKTKIKLIKGLINGKFQEQDIDDTLRDLAKSTYSAFADDIDKNPNISFQDIISPYIQMYNNMLEKSGIDTNVAKVLGLATKDGKKLTISEFQQALKKSEEYQFTSQAKLDASNLAVSFARAFGVNV